MKSRCATAALSVMQENLFRYVRSWDEVQLVNIVILGSRFVDREGYEQEAHLPRWVAIRGITLVRIARIQQADRSPQRKRV